MVSTDTMSDPILIVSQCDLHFMVHKFYHKHCFMDLHYTGCIKKTVHSFLKKLLLVYYQGNFLYS